MTESLSAILRRHRVNSLVHQATLIQDFPDTEQRIAEARRMIRTVLYERTLGRIDDEEKHCILEELQLVRTRCTIETQEPIPTYQDEEAERKVLEEDGKDLPKKQQSFLFIP